MSKHTPGPWAECDGEVFVKATERSIALIQDDDNAEADARLIAAAPELLAELKHLVRLMEPDEESGNLHIRGLATLNGARAAIAKAEGK